MTSKLKSIHIEPKYHFYLKMVSLQKGVSIKEIIEEHAKSLKTEHKIKEPNKFKNE